MLAFQSSTTSLQDLSKHKILAYIESQILQLLSGLRKAMVGDGKKSGISAFRLKSLARSVAVWRNIYDCTINGTQIMKRDLYYANVKLFSDQPVSNGLVSRMARTLNVQHRSMGIVTSSKGLVHGSVSWRDPQANTTVSAEVETRLVPADFENLASPCSSILVIEKESSFHAICSLDITKHANCVLVTAKGYPDNQTRSFIRSLSRNGHLPVLILTDCDPHGIDIFKCFRDGSQSNLFDPIPFCSWIGIELSDIDSSQLLPLTPKDRNLAQALLLDLTPDPGPNSRFIQAQMNRMLDLNAKAEMEAIVVGSLSGSELLSFLLQKVNLWMR
jgi:meiotic recombination protein SPO11